MIPLYKSKYVRKISFVIPMLSFIFAFIGSANARTFYFYDPLEGLVNSVCATPFCEDGYPNDGYVSISIADGIVLEPTEEIVTIPFIISAFNNISIGDVNLQVSMENNNVVSNVSLIDNDGEDRILQISRLAADNLSSGAVTIRFSAIVGQIQELNKEFKITIASACADSIDTADHNIYCDEDDNYLIASAADLLHLSHNQVDPDIGSDILRGDYKLTNNISFDIGFNASAVYDADGFLADISKTLNYNNVDWNGDDVVDSSDDSGWIPLGDVSQGVYFSGSIDGDTHIINNLYIERAADYQGFLGRAISSDIRNLGVYGYIAGDRYVGGLSGRNDSSEIHDSYFIGDLYSQDSYVGGLIGRANDMLIENSYTEGNYVVDNGIIPGDDTVYEHIGGLVGDLYNSIIISSSSSAYIYASSSSAGGLVGSSVNSIISSSNATGNVITGNYRAGGLVAYNATGEISSCYATGDVKGFANFSVGGLVGQNNADLTINSYATGNVYANNSSGGLIGHMTGTIINSYATGNSSSGGVLVGSNHGAIINSYGLGESPTNLLVSSNSGLIDNTNDRCLSSSDCDSAAVLLLKAGRDYYPWDDSAWEDLNNTTARLEWERVGVVDSNLIVPDLTYPNICNNVSPLDVMDNDGEYYLIGGLLGDPIKAKNELLCISNIEDDGNVFSANYKLTADIVFGAEDWNGDGIVDDSDSSGWNPISKFLGVFEGDNHSISNLFIDNSSSAYQGLFANLISATVKNISLLNISIDGGNYSGGLSGFAATSDIDNISITGSVSGGYNVGGLLGIANQSVISNIHASSGDVAGSFYLGGIIGKGDVSSLTSSSSSLDVIGSSAHVGGLVGHGSGYNFTISKSYSTGQVQGDYNVAGIVGYMYGTMSEVYSDSVVSGNHSIGGLVGKAGHFLRMNNVYAKGDASGDDYIGGLVGDMGSNTYDYPSYITNGYYSGTIDGDNYAGGLFGRGRTRSIVNDSYLIPVAISGTSYIGGIMGGLEDAETVYELNNAAGVCDMVGDVNTVDISSYTCSPADMYSLHTSWDANIWDGLGTSNTPSLKYFSE